MISTMEYESKTYYMDGYVCMHGGIDGLLSIQPYNQPSIYWLTHPSNYIIDARMHRGIGIHPTVQSTINPLTHPSNYIIDACMHGGIGIHSTVQSTINPLTHPSNYNIDACMYGGMDLLPTIHSSNHLLKLSSIHLSIQLHYLSMNNSNFATYS